LSWHPGQVQKVPLGAIGPMSAMEPAVGVTCRHATMASAAYGRCVCTKVVSSVVPPAVDIENTGESERDTSITCLAVRRCSSRNRISSNAQRIRTRMPGRASGSMLLRIPSGPVRSVTCQALTEDDLCQGTSYLKLMHVSRYFWRQTVVKAWGWVAQVVAVYTKKMGPLWFAMTSMLYFRYGAQY
jgi:hypothetical protein